MSNGNTTHTVKYEQPGIISALPYNKVAQFALGCVLLLVAFRLFTSGWFSLVVFNAIDRPVPDAGMGMGIGIIPFLIDAVCLVGLAGFAVLAMVRSLIGPIFAGLPEWLASFRAEAAATHAAVETGFKTTSGRDLTVPELLQVLAKRIAKLEAKTAGLPEPEPPAPPKTKEDLLMEQLAALTAKVESMESPTAPKTPRSKANG